MSIKFFVQKIIQRYNWQILSNQELLNYLVSLNTTDIQGLEMASKKYYSRVLYEACQQIEDKTKQNYAFGELHQYLYRCTIKLYGNNNPELNQEITQLALELVYRQLAQCKNPYIFLKFSQYKVLQAGKKLLPARKVMEELELTENLKAELTLNRTAQNLVLDKALMRLADVRQRTVIVLKYFGGWSDEEIAKQLEITPNNVRVIRNRGIAKLKADLQLQNDLSNLEQ